MRRAGDGNAHPQIRRTRSVHSVFRENRNALNLKINRRLIHKNKRTIPKTIAFLNKIKRIYRIGFFLNFSCLSSSSCLKWFSILLAGAVDKDVFKFISDFWDGEMVVIRDNLPARRDWGVKDLIEKRKAKRIYLSPIHRIWLKCWSKIKSGLKCAQARMRAKLEKASAEALLLISAKTAESWFRSCGKAANCFLICFSCF